MNKKMIIFLDQSMVLTYQQGQAYWADQRFRHLAGSMHSLVNKDVCITKFIGQFVNITIEVVILQ